MAAGARGQFVVQGEKLSGTGAVLPGYLGTGVALSADGNTALAGGYKDAGNVGAAWVFTRSGGIWTQQGTKLAGTDVTGITYQGIRVALSGDGNTALIGGNGDGQGRGAAWVFARSGSPLAEESAAEAALSCACLPPSCSARECSLAVSICALAEANCTAASSTDRRGRAPFL